MQLKAVRIMGYRSLYDVRVTPGKLTVLTGPNNSGKTNFVEAIDFLSEIYHHGLEPAINSKGGLENIAHRRASRTRRSVEFAVEATVTRADIAKSGWGAENATSLRYLHQFAVAPLSQRIDADYRITSEKLTIGTARSSVPFFSYSREGDIISSNLDEKRIGRLPWLQEFRYFFERRFIAQLQPRLRSTDLFMNGYLPFDFGFATGMRRIRLYQFVPLEGRRPGVPTPNAEADTHGANLPAQVSFMKKNQPEAWSHVINSMRRLVPDLVDIKTEFTPDRRLALQFVERRIGRPWSAEDVSDGTIQALGMYTALFDQRSSLILIEEPENSLHSWITRNFIDACRQAQDRQIILTTHSPALLSYLAPHEVSVTWKRQGRTHIKPLIQIDPSIADTWNEGNLSVFEMLDSGLFPEAVPGNDDEVEEIE